jgi:regulator of protease activity HflC (stomatin/prohibitin superfamily)
VQIAVLSEGRYFRDPYEWRWEIVPQTEIPAGKLGVKIRLYGENLPYGEFLATKENRKGILPGVLNPGLHQINPYVEQIELHEPVTIPAGFRGVETNLSGAMPENPNVILVARGMRGVQETALDPGTYYFNPYERRISLVDCRSQRINLAEERDLGFPSKDGFWVSLDGIVEFRIKPEKAAEVFVTYNENENGDRIDEEIRNKIILPNARSFCRLEGSDSLGREFIQGVTRTKFQESFQTEMRAACDPLGIEIIQALITRINPPEKIAKPVRAREIAKQEQKQYLQETLQQQSEQELAVQRALVERKQAVVKADQEVVKLTVEAMQKQTVAVTKANELLAVAKIKLTAAKDEAAAVQSRGKAAAEVVKFENAAQAAGWKQAVSAFQGDGMRYARFVLLEKLAPAYRQIMVNTADSPIMDIFKTFAPQPETRGPQKATTAQGNQ